MRDGTASTLLGLDSWAAKPRKVCGEHGRIVIFSALTEYVRGVKINMDAVKACGGSLGR